MCNDTIMNKGTDMPQTNLVMTAEYTSPFSGKVYKILTEIDWIQAWDIDGNPYKNWYTRYNFYHGGKKVLYTLSLDENHLNATFGELEGVYKPWATSARD